MHQVKSFLSDKPETPLSEYVKTMGAQLSLGATSLGDESSDEEEEEQQPKKKKKTEAQSPIPSKKSKMMDDGAVHEEDIVEAFEGFSDDDE